MENTYIPYPDHLRSQIKVYINFWSKKSLGKGLKDKGGSFNLNLYLDYLEVVNSQVNENESKAFKK
jgi:hypothetical protein